MFARKTRGNLAHFFGTETQDHFASHVVPGAFFLWLPLHACGGTERRFTVSISDKDSGVGGWAGGS